MGFNYRKSLPESVTGVAKIQSHCYKANEIIMGTRWSLNAILHSRYVWIPMSGSTLWWVSAVCEALIVRYTTMTNIESPSSTACCPGIEFYFLILHLTQWNKITSLYQLVKRKLILAYTICLRPTLILTTINAKWSLNFGHCFDDSLESFK